MISEIYKPKRIGHITLVHKFQHTFAEIVQDHEDIVAILKEIKHQQLELDVNSAGLAKPYCLEIYPPLSYIKLAKESRDSTCIWIGCTSSKRFTSVLQ